VSRRATKWLIILGVTGIVLIAAGVGGYYWLRSRHDSQIEDRLNRFSPIIWKYAEQYSIPRDLLREMIRAESGGDEHAQSARGAKGLMQLTDIAVREVLRTNKKIGDGNLFDPDYNIHVGSAYLREMLNKFDGDAYLAVAAYHMGDAELRKVRKDNPDPNVTGRQIVEQIASPATKKYCQTILGGKDLRLPKTR
jgi:soluble lytic murein transglycosylase-like protein